MKTTLSLRAATLSVAARAATNYIIPQMAFASGRNAIAASPPGMASAWGTASSQDQVSKRDAEARLNKTQFNNVRVDVRDGIATLTGTVDLYQHKADAQKRVSKAKEVKATRNQIEVTSPSIADNALQQDLVDRLSYDRVGYGNVFNAIGVKVDRGVVYLDGHARTYMDRDSAVALVATTPGVRDLVDSIDVDPVSIMDDEIRIKVARAVYGYSPLQKYAIDPAKPIRISVQDGKVSLYGVVNNRMDANIAYMRANGVPGVFQVNSYLQVPGETSESLN